MADAAVGSDLEHPNLPIAVVADANHPVPHLSLIHQVFRFTIPSLLRRRSEMVDVESPTVVVDRPAQLPLIHQVVKCATPPLMTLLVGKSTRNPNSLVAAPATWCFVAAYCFYWMLVRKLKSQSQSQSQSLPPPDQMLKAIAEAFGFVAMLSLLSLLIMPLPESTRMPASVVVPVALGCIFLLVLCAHVWGCQIVQLFQRRVRRQHLPVVEAGLSPVHGYELAV